MKLDRPKYKNFAPGKRITARGALRHPDFVRWRDDKPAEDCVWNGKR